MPRIFVTRSIPDNGLKLMRDALGAGSVDVFPHDRVISRDELFTGAKGADALLPTLADPVDTAIMDTAGPQLKIIANYAVGYNNIDVKAATERRIPVTNTPGVLTETTADLTWAILMDTARRISEGERYVRGGKWQGWAPQLLLGADVHGKTLGIFGMGRIGQAVARRAVGFGMRVVYTSRGRLEPFLERQLNARLVDKATLLAESDFISIHCPLLPETRHAFGAVEFKAMKKSACLINTSRGPVVDEAALAAALKAGDIFAAGLDVFEEEPKIHPDLLTCENAVLVPHLGSASLETRAKMAEIAASNIVARLQGKTPPNCVNPEVL
ncbi:MAG: D-glycerate dehydrogenase [Candidatus Hydrogenedentes bacterium]|nr:D-glycerate dehydrogenase [Candidatus Hydrogenedentota bacterium]